MYDVQKGHKPFTTYYTKPPSCCLEAPTPQMLHFEEPETPKSIFSTYTEMP